MTSKSTRKLDASSSKPSKTNTTSISYLDGLNLSLSVCNCLQYLKKGIFALSFVTKLLDVRLIEALIHGMDNRKVRRLGLVYRERTCGSKVGGFLSRLADFVKTHANLEKLVVWHENDGEGEEESSPQESAALAKGFATFVEALVLNPVLEEYLLCRPWSGRQVRANLRRGFTKDDWIETFAL